MADDLEAFLRQAAQRRAGRKKPAPAQPRPQQPRPQQPSPPQSSPPQARRPQPARRPTVVEAEVVEATLISDPTNRLEMNVDTSDFDRRAEHLGEEVGLADENLEARLHEKFDHQLGALSEEDVDFPGSSEAAAEASFAAVDEITRLLANPQSLRNAIVLSEIFAPPEHRW